MSRRASAVFGEEDLAVVSLEIRVIYRRNGFPLGCQTKKLLSKEEERGQITESCEL